MQHILNVELQIIFKKKEELLANPLVGNGNFGNVIKTLRYIWVIVFEQSDNN